MLWLVISGVKPYDGRYEFDLDDVEFTTREWGWIKRYSGVLPATVEEAFLGGDAELIAVFAVIALRRAGRVENAEIPEVFDRIADAPFGSTIRLENDTPQETEEDDASPPVSSSNGSDSFSGDGSTVSSDRSETNPDPFGTRVSATSAWGPPRSVT